MKRNLPRIILLAVGMMISWLAAATVVERVCGSETAHAVGYHSWLFIGLWAIIAAAGTAQCFICRLYRRPATFCLHIALLVILAGAAMTWFTAVEGKMQLMRECDANSIEANDGTIVPLPFTVVLQRFEMQYYAGTQTPAAFEAIIQFRDNNNVELKPVSLNHIATFKGYRFCLSGYDDGGNGVALKVTHDPLGIAVTQVGYLLLLISILIFLSSSHTRFRTTVKQLTANVSAVLLLALIFPTMSHAEPNALPRDVADDFGKLLVLHNGRIAPFETMAREVTTKLCGKTSYHGYSACQVVTGWWFYYDEWAAEPIIKVKSRKIQQLLGCESRYVSFNDFFDSKRYYKLEPRLTNPTKEVLEANEKCQVASALGLGDLFRIMPLQRDGTLQWYVPGALQIPNDIDEGKWALMKNGMNYFHELVIKEDWSSCRVFINQLRRYQQQEGTGLLPTRSRLKAELIYNRLESTLLCAIALLLLGLLTLPTIINHHGTVGKRANRILIAVRAMLVLIFLYQSLLLSLRWVAGGHLPMASGYETMFLMSWLTLLTTILMSRRTSLITAIGALAAGFAMLVAGISGSNPAITPLMPVLNSPWLCLHVATVMFAYAIIAVMTVNSLCGLAYRRRASLVNHFHLVGKVLLYPAVFMLTAGIFIGAVWAEVSWGSYWSWDPKETWALITLLIYAMPLHEASLQKFRKPLFFHTYIILAFLSVAITYWGVNHLLGGMHSYA